MLFRISRRAAPFHFPLLFLPQVMEENGDKHIDLLKFDIEGYEWRLLEEEILSKDGLLPKQLMFEVKPFEEYKTNDI